MTDTPDNKNSPHSAPEGDERWFDELYDSIDAPSSPAEVDARIALAAAEAVAPAPKRWGIGLASAAVVLLSVGIFLGTDDADLNVSSTKFKLEEAQPAAAEPRSRQLDDVQSEASNSAGIATKPASHEPTADAAIPIEVVSQAAREDSEQSPAVSSAPPPPSPQRPAQASFRLESEAHIPPPAPAESTAAAELSAPEQSATGAISDRNDEASGEPAPAALLERDTLQEVIVTASKRRDVDGPTNSLREATCKDTTLRLEPADARAESAIEGIIADAPASAVSIERCRSAYRITIEASSCENPLVLPRRMTHIAGGVLRWQDGVPIKCTDGEWNTPAGFSLEQ